MDITHTQTLAEQYMEDQDALQPPDADSDTWSDHNKLLSPRAVQKQYRQLEWYEELNKIGQHWHPKTSDQDPVWREQLRQAYLWTNVALWANGTGDFLHRSDADAVINKAMKYLEADIKSYDPQRSALGARISNMIGLRLKDALAYCTISRDHGAWADQLTLQQSLFPADPARREAWINGVIKETFHFYAKRIDSIASKPEVRKAVRNQLRDLLLDFDPHDQSLHTLVEQWVTSALHGDQTDITQSSLDTPAGEEGDGSVGELIPDHRFDPSDIVEQANEYSVILIALVANYHLHIGKGSLKTRVLYSRLNYTEQLSYFAQALPLPDDHRQDLLKPLEEDYFRYFMQVAPTAALTLRTIERARIRSVVGTGPFRLENVCWDDQGFLPAKSQMGYLNGKGISSSNSSVSGQRKPYRESFLDALRKRL